MKALRRFFAHYEAYHQYSRLPLYYMSVAGMVMYPALYMLRFTKSSTAYDDLAWRVLSVVLLLGAMMRDRWPARLKPFYMPYTYMVLTICLPMFFVFTSL
jgi:two-component system, CAI-1 autoinducer sensor kinase/phosphatase CqsS